MRRKRSSIDKLIGLLTVAMIVLAILFPILFAGESKAQETLTSSTNQSLKTTDTLNEINSKSVTPFQEDATASTTASIEESVTEEPEASIKKERIAPKIALTNRVQVTEWGIYDAGNEKLTTSNPAISDKAYTLKFNWQIANTAENPVQPGDYFTLLIPQNEGTLDDQSDANGHWHVNSSVSATPIMATIEGVSVKIGEWFIEASPEHNYTTQQVRIQFTSGVSHLTASTISGTNFNIGDQALKNYTVKAGLQKVAFGGLTQQIYFNAREVSPANAYSYKNAMSAGTNSIQFSIPVNLPTGNELGGDVFDEKVNPKTGWYYNAENPQYGWGEHATDVQGIYVEDELDAGATLGSIMISATTRVPIMFPFTEKNPYDGTKQAGGLTSSAPAYESYVLFDGGKGPEYRTSNGTGMRQKPTQATSFDRIIQKNGESKEAFKARVKARDYQYGIYYDASSQKSTVMVYFGDVSSSSNEANKLKKLSDLTSQKYASSGRKVSGTSIPVLDFAVQAADYLIKNGFYTAADRTLIEDYFTLTYGDSNVLGGQAPIFNISLMVRYPPETASEEKTNTVNFYQDSKKVVNETNPQSRSVSTWLNNPYSSIQLQSNEAILFKFDEKKNPMTGVRFGLQKLNGTTWQTITGKEYTTDVITVPVAVKDSEGNIKIEQQSLEGGILTGVLDNGTYRFIELESPTGYDKTLSPNYDAAAKAVVSEEFTLPHSGNAPTRHVTNVSAPTYTVLHYVQQQAESSSGQADFDLKYQETLKAETDAAVTAKERTFAGYRYIPEHALEVKTGVVKSDGSLVLKLYYQIDTTISPFSINKVDMNGNPMPSYNNKGDPLGPEKTVTFDVYVYNANWTGVRTTHPEEEAGKEEKDRTWKRLVIAGEPVTITTDANGKIRDSRIELTNQAGDLQTFALVEKQTYQGYQLPDEDSAIKNIYWIVYTTNDNGTTDAKISDVVGIGLNGAKNPGAGKADGEPFIKNEKKGWTIYKEDMLGNPMPSFDSEGAPLEEQVTFQLYRLKSGEAKEHPPSDERYWQIMEGYTYTTDQNGMLIGEKDIPSSGTHALVETSTYSDFHCPSASQAYWVLWSSGYIDAYGTNTPGVRYVAKYNYAIKNERATATTIYKADATTKRAMPSDEKQSVAFKYYKYIGGWIGGEGPKTNQDLTDTTKWTPLINPEYNVTDPSEDKFLFETDSQGRLTKLNEVFTGINTYAIQEVKTYDGYQLDDQAYWIAYVKHKIESDKTTPLIIGDIAYVQPGSDPSYPYLRPGAVDNPFNEFVLTNKAYQYPTLRFHKENEVRDPLGNVEFSLYAGRPNGNWETDSEDPAAENTYWNMQESFRTAKSSLSGLVEMERLEPGRYLLIETKTAEGYQLPQGEWVITVEEVEEEIKITEIRARDGTSPPAFRIDNGNYYLPNYLTNALPRAGGYLRLFLAVIGIVLLGSVVLVFQNRKGGKINQEKGKEDEKKSK
ncbi:prealbumin-like fold domain-containing protein [Enterococcus gilvus]|uniref:prealbumin-like fold domain-containing protein n=1 Tax=Enterococcus gilvus TaxID=160453 RepID=UPI001C8C2C8F|nr:prealbumin-like fold domain-containing protein [Enterococcus gilvus]